MNAIAVEYKVRKSIYTTTKVLEDGFERVTGFLNSVKDSVKKIKESIGPSIKKQFLKKSGLRESIETVEAVLPEIFRRATSAETYGVKYSFGHKLKNNPVRWEKIFVGLQNVPLPDFRVYQEGNWYFLVEECWYAVKKNGQFFSVDTLESEFVDRELFSPTNEIDEILSLVRISQKGITVYLLTQ